MKEFENNAFFWQKVDALFSSGDFKVIHEEGSNHELYPSLVYPCDYGVVKTLNSDETPIEAFKAKDGKKVDAIVLCADIITKRFEAKALIGLDEQQVEDVLRFLNCTECQKSVIIKRGKTIPSWAATE